MKTEYEKMLGGKTFHRKRKSEDCKNGFAHKKASLFLSC